MSFPLDNLRISVVIPTRNRAAMLESCLGGIANQQADRKIDQVIVVDNGDDQGATSMVAEKALEHLPVTYLFSDIPDVCRARNLGLAEAVGDVTLFLDDDEVPYPNWLTEAIRPFTDKSINADIVAGNYVPQWEIPRPSWLSDEYFGLYSAGLDLGNTPRFLSENEWILEGNVGIRTELLRGAGGFDESLGRKGQALISGEGVVFQQLVGQQGAKLFYNPECLVSHRIHADRLTKQWLRKRMFASGITRALGEKSRLSKGLSIPPVKVNIGALAYLDFELLEGEELLHANQIFEILGYICSKQRLI